MISTSEIQVLYQQIKVQNLGTRYTPPSSIEAVINQAKLQGNFSVLGRSFQGRDIGYVSIGQGPIRVLAWSQMHGDESTTTRALIDLFSFLTVYANQVALVNDILERYTIRIIFQLNPDGAQAYTRENAEGYDLNRDALALNQPESRLLIDLATEFAPDLCLNCHDQRSLYSLSHSIDPPQISFLAPAADEKLSLTKARVKAIERICLAHSVLNEAGFSKVGRYDESYCGDCFGDYFQSQGIPTVLIESGHIIGDTHREDSRFVVFMALLGILKDNLDDVSGSDAHECYFALPENLNIIRDVVLHNVHYNDRLVDIGLQNRHVLDKDRLITETYIHDIRPKGTLLGYKSFELNQEEILIDSHENDFEGKIISNIRVKSSGLLIKIQ